MASQRLAVWAHCLLCLGHGKSSGRPDCQHSNSSLCLLAVWPQAASLTSLCLGLSPVTQGTL